MNEIDAEGGGALAFPDPREEAYARAEEFRRLSPDGRWKEIVSIMGWGLNLARSSPRRVAIEQRWETQEQEWQRLQQALLEQYGD